MLTINDSSRESNPISSFEKVILIEEIFQQVRDFLNDTKTGANNILNVSRKCQDIKKSSYYWKLNRASSLEYYGNIFYKSRLDSLLTNGKSQIAINLKCTLCDVHNLNMIICSAIRDVSAFGNVHALDLSHCHGIRDVSALGHVHTLKLSRCIGISDVSALGNVNTLDISYCQGITDVSALVNVNTLDIRGCIGITYVSSLSAVVTLIR
jgi:hypothetical protein